MSESGKKKHFRFCPHCSRDVSKSTYYHHKSLYRFRETELSPGLDEIDVSSFEESSNESDICSLGSDDLDRSEPSAEVYHDSISCDGQGDLVERTSLSKEQAGSGDDPSDLESDEENSEIEDSCEIWDTDVSEDEGFDWTEGEELADTRNSSDIQTHYYCRLIAIFLLSWQYKFGLSDSSVGALLRFLHIFLSLLNKIIQSQFLTCIVTMFPKSVVQCRKILKISDNSFEKYVSCAKCRSIYKYDMCIERSLRGKLTSKRCPYVAFPKHPQTFHRKPCGAFLLKEVKYGPKTFCYPYRTYCWKSIINTLHGLLCRPGLLDKCEHWRTRTIESGVLHDIYDGRVWNDFQVVSGRDFLKQPHNLGLMMNIDWFQPFKRTTYSVGVIYLVVMNLPREERFLPQNVVICGIIPGPSEPKRNINHFLLPLVSDLRKLWTGVFMDIPKYPLPIFVRVALLCTASDLPATRKCCGFTSHNSTMGCSKCLKKFTIKVKEKSDYSGYDRQNWISRTREHHQHHYSLKYRNANTRAAQIAVAKSTGVRYTLLQELDYFDCVRFHVVDPMHNLLLGTGKHALSVWIKLEIIRPSQYDQLQEIVDTFSFPSDIGRIPYKIASGFSGFTADQWRTWIIILSPIILKEILPPVHYCCWSLFVEACYLLCCRSVSLSSVDKADDLLLEFCTTFVNLYGADFSTANMHMHCHLKESIIDYGPVYSIWLFSFERFNGLLGGIPSNKRSIEPQLMKRFVCDQQLHSESLVSELDVSNTREILSSFHILKGSVSQQTDSEATKSLSSVFSTVLYSVLGPVVEDVLETDSHNLLSSRYSVEEPTSFVKCLCLYQKVGAVLYNGRIYGSSRSRRLKASYVIAKHPITGYRAAQINYFCLHKVVIKVGRQQRIITQICAAVSWYDLHPEQQWFCKPAMVFCKHFHSDGFVFQILHAD